MTSQKLLSGFMLLLVIQAVATMIVGTLGLTFPAPLLGMLLLTFLLVTQIIKVEQVKDACTLLLEKMSILFVPGAVGAIRYMEHISKEFFPLIATIFVSAAIVLVVTGVFLQFILRLKGGQKHA